MLEKGRSEMVDMLKALADETRLRMFSLIVQGDLCVCEIEACLEITQSNASRHLNTLKKAGILDNYKIAQWTYYKISEEFIKDNQELYIYLNKKMKESYLYQKDREALRICKAKELCGCKNNKEEM